MGINPRAPDTDGDHILDGYEEGYGEDATLFDDCAPQVTVKYVDFYPCDTFNAKYRVLFDVSDPAGINNVDVKKNGGTRQHFTLPEGTTGAALFSSFDSNIVETVIGLMGTTRIDIYADDRNNNGHSTYAHHWPSVVGQLSAWLTSHYPDADVLAGAMGVWSGSYYALKEIPEGLAQLVSDPSGTLEE